MQAVGISTEPLPNSLLQFSWSEPAELAKWKKHQRLQGQKAYSNVLLQCAVDQYPRAQFLLLDANEPCSTIATSEKTRTTLFHSATVQSGFEAFCVAAVTHRLRGLGRVGAEEFANVRAMSWGTPAWYYSTLAAHAILCSTGHLRYTVQGHNMPRPKLSWFISGPDLLSTAHLVRLILLAMQLSALRWSNYIEVTGHTCLQFNLVSIFCR